MPKERYSKCIAYMKNLPGIQSATVDQVCSKALALAKKTQLDALLEFKVGASPKGEQGNQGWRNAARSLVLLRLIADYRGQGSIDEFAKSSKDALIRDNNTEADLKRLIESKLTAISTSNVTDPTRYYIVTDSTAPGVEAFVGRALPAGDAPLRVSTTGHWMNCVYETAEDRNHPYCADFTKNPELVGIYTDGASGGCVPIAFLYGMRGAPLEAVTMWHTPGGGMRKEYVEQMKFPAKPNLAPIEIVVYSYMNPLDNHGFGPNQIETLRGWGYNAPRVTYYHDGSAVLAIDKWGRFGSLALNVRSNKTKVKNMETDGGWRGGEHYVVKQPQIDKL